VVEGRGNSRSHLVDDARIRSHGWLSLVDVSALDSLQGFATVSLAVEVHRLAKSTLDSTRSNSGERR